VREGKPIKGGRVQQAALRNQAEAAEPDRKPEPALFPEREGFGSLGSAKRISLEEAGRD